MSNSTEDHVSYSKERGLYTIRVKGLLDPRWSDWFDGLTVTATGTGETVLSGLVADQSALHGLLERIRDLNLTLISVSQTEAKLQQEGDDEG